MSDAKSWIAAPLGYAPSRDERAFFEGERPWGFILFGRNLASPGQLAASSGQISAAMWFSSDMSGCLERVIFTSCTTRVIFTIRQVW